MAQLSPDGNSCSAAAAQLGSTAARVPRGLRVRRESAMAAARESALLMSGRRCEQRREERRQQMRMMRPWRPPVAHCSPRRSARPWAISSGCAC